MAWRHDRAVMAYKGTETDVLYGVEMALRADATVPVNSMSFIWNDNMREKREANANAT